MTKTMTTKKYAGSYAVYILEIQKPDTHHNITPDSHATRQTTLLELCSHDPYL